MRRNAKAAAAILAAAALLGACTSGGASSTAGSAAGGGGVRVPVAEGDAAGVPGSSAGGGAVQTTDLVDPSAKIRRVEMTVGIKRAPDVAAAADKAGAIAATYGGEVYGDDRVAGDDAHATVILQIPPGNLQPALRDLSKLGTEKSRTSSTVDVTQQVADVNSRLQSLRAEIATLTALYQRRNQRLSDVLEVERELAQRQSDLDALEAQQRVLLGQTATATVTLDLVTATAVVHKRSTGFLSGLRRGWDAFVASAVAVATGLGAAAPFLVLLLVLAAAARWLGVRLPARRRRPVTPAGD